MEQERLLHLLNEILRYLLDTLLDLPRLPNSPHLPNSKPNLKLHPSPSKPLNSLCLSQNRFISNEFPVLLQKNDPLPLSITALDDKVDYLLS